MYRVLVLLLTAILTLCFTQKPITLYMIGDSTMANKTEEAKPETGWGQVLQSFFTEKVVVSNHAKNGRSSKSFRGEGLWNEVYDNLRPGDYVIIQFGHNDQKSDSARHTDPHTTYDANLLQYINETKQKGATPILCTSIVRRHFDEDGKLIDTHDEYPDVVRAVAAEQGVPLIDLEKLTRDLVTQLGPEESKKLFLHTKPGEYPNRPDGVVDNTHLNETGARKVAELAVESLRKQGHELAKYLAE